MRAKRKVKEDRVAFQLKCQMERAWQGPLMNAFRGARWGLYKGRSLSCRNQTHFPPPRGGSKD